MQRDPLHGLDIQNITDGLSIPPSQLGHGSVLKEEYDRPCRSTSPSGFVFGSVYRVVNIGHFRHALICSPLSEYYRASSRASRGSACLAILALCLGPSFVYSLLRGRAKFGVLGHGSKALT